MPDTIFTILYILYKIGGAFLVLGFPLLIVAIVTLISNATGCLENFSIKASLCVGLVALLFLSIGAITPNIEEIKAYAVYTIHKTSANTKEAQELIDAVIHYIEAGPAKN